MSRSIHRWVLLLACCLAALPVQARTYRAVLDAAVWSVDASPLECRLNHSLPTYGTAVFELKAGEPLRFYLKTQAFLRDEGVAQLALLAPEWHGNIRPQPLGEARMHAGQTPLSIDETLATQFLTGLQGGLFPSIDYHDATGEDVRIDVSSVNFQKAYQTYTGCVAALFPANFEQLKASRLQYGMDEWKLTDAIKTRLDLIVGYLALDPTIKKIFVDGHTDRVGRQGNNWEISRLRANAVREYLIGKGIAADTIVMRYYGETHLLVKTKNNVPVAANRRVIVQLSRG